MWEMINSGLKFDFLKVRQNGFSDSVFEETCFSAKFRIRTNDKIEDEKICKPLPLERTQSDKL